MTKHVISRRVSSYSDSLLDRKQGVVCNKQCLFGKEKEYSSKNKGVMGSYVLEILAHPLQGQNLHLKGSINSSNIALGGAQKRVLLWRDNLCSRQGAQDGTSDSWVSSDLLLFNASPEPP